MKEREDDMRKLFASDSSVIGLHKLLWNSQEKIGKYLAVER